MKASSLSTYKIAEQDFSYFFPDDPPTFIFSPTNRRRGRPPKRVSISKVSREWMKNYIVALNKTSKSRACLAPLVHIALGRGTFLCIQSVLLYVGNDLAMRLVEVCSVN